MPNSQEELKKLLEAPLQDADLQQDPLKTVLQNVQGNVLHGHGRNFAIHTFLKFQPGKQTEVKQWLRDHIVCKITSAQDQLTERQEKNRDALFVSCMLSASGYDFLRQRARAPQFSKEFLDGMKRATDRLKEPSYTSWEDNYQQTIDAMILLAHHDKNMLLDAQKTLIDDYIGPLTAHHWPESGNVLRRDGLSVEHFGYVDSHSQPLFFQRDLEKERQERGIDEWNPGVGPHLVLTQDPLGEVTTDYGSYVVFRKLEQDVARFERQIHSFAQDMGIDEEVAMARVVGRFRDGTPLVRSDTPSGSPGAMVPNNFRYDTDWDGQRCPFTTHIRRMNPRWAPGELEYDRRIARRGIPYSAPDDKSVGMLFICYQQSLKDQFEALQGKWAQSPEAFPPTLEADRLIGREPTGEELDELKKRAVPGQATAPSVSNCVTLKGGEYFFAPSKRVLRDILTCP